MIKETKGNGWSCGAAIFSPCQTWRYVLTRRWRSLWVSPENSIAFVGLNPSTADETTDDPTVRRCVGYAKDWGYAGLIMLNAYAFRATDPQVMKAAPDPMGPENADWLRYYGQQVSEVVVAWGTHCTPEHARRVYELLGRPVVCLGKNADGSPKHPLYLRKTAERIPWEPTP